MEVYDIKLDNLWSSRGLQTQCKMEIWKKIYKKNLQILVLKMILGIKFATFFRFANSADSSAY